MRLVLILVFAAGALSGCASAGFQYESLRQNRGNLPSSHLITTVEFEDQPAGYCGPATLGMVMRSHGREVSTPTLAGQMLTPGLRGTLQEDMLGAARRQGFVVVPIRSFKDLLYEVSAGNPVIIFENLGLSWYPQWHYAVVLGFDLIRQEVTLHSGSSAYLTENMKVFENSWRLSEYWAVIVLPPGKLAATAGERAHSEAAVFLDKLGKHEEAAKAYDSILKKWPDSLVSAIGLSHFYFKQNEFEKAKDLLLSARRFHPESEAIRHNLTVISNGASALRAKAQTL